MKPRSLVRRLLKGLLALAAALLAGGALGFGLLVLAFRSPYKGYRAASVLVEIPSGTSTREILLALERGGVVRDRRVGLAGLRLFFRGRTLKAGEYRFSGERSCEQVLLSLIAGDVVSYRVTIPEGYAAAEVFALLASQRFSTEARLEALNARPDPAFGLPAEARTLEGFLFPETYTLTRSMSAREIVGLMVHEFHRRLPVDHALRAGEAGLTLYQSVTLASLVEKETAVASERPLVASVYRNRLRIGMLLQCDPTTIYALRRLGRWRGVLLRTDLSVDEPYNTYVRPGLPPGPICSPGQASLFAAVAPVSADYLYFVAAGDGTHRFAVSYADQQRNVASYRRARRSRPIGAPRPSMEPPPK